MSDADRILAAVLRAGLEGPAIEAGLSTVGIQVSNAIKERIRSSGASGRTYRRGGVVHQASAPGQPPAIDTGRLVGSYNWQLGRDARGPFVEVGTNVDYAPHLEFGTRKMAARPHVRITIEEQAKTIGVRLAEAIAAGQRRQAAKYPSKIER